MPKGNTKAEITKIKRIRTPRGVAAFAYLQKPDDSFGKNRYRIDMFWPDYKENPEFTEFLKTLSKMNADFLKGLSRKATKVPGCMKVTDAKLAELVGVPVGTPHMSFETNADTAKGPIPVFNAKAEREDSLLVYGGDIVRVETTISGWELPTGAGINGYLNSVQLLKSNWAGGAGSTFEAEQDFLDEDAPEANDDVADALEEEDESPFEEDEASEEETPPVKKSARGAKKSTTSTPVTASPKKGRPAGS